MRLLAVGSTFKPILSEKSKEIVSQKKKKYPTFEDLYREAKVKMDKKKKKMEERKQQMAEKELEGVTFKPNL